MIIICYYRSFLQVDFRIQYQLIKLVWSYKKLFNKLMLAERLCFKWYGKTEAYRHGFSRSAESH